MPDLQTLTEVVLKGDANASKALTEDALEAGVEPLTLLNQHLVPAMNEVGRRFECNEFFVPELLLAARAMKASLELIRPILAQRGTERKLPRSLLTPLVQAGILYADTRANAVFLLGDTPATAVGAELRGTTSQSWRGMAPGSRKDRGFFSVSTASAQAIVLCESAIDALSCHALHPTYRCLSTSGARPDPAWLSTLLGRGLPILCGFDADPIGDAMAQRMSELHPTIRRLRPPAKDWNDFLRLQFG
jgi:hypothetical protein